MLCKSYSIFYLLFCLTTIEEGSATCSQGSYLNLCGYCVGGITDKNDVEGLDRCRICDGQSDCVGCDGIVNSLRRRDTCGLCLSPQAEQWNDCRKIDKVYPSFIDLAIDRNIVPLTITGAGLKQYFLNSTKCLIQPLESQSDNPEIKEIALEDNDIQLKINLTESTGSYRIGCSEIEGFAELIIADSRKLNVLKVNPSEVKVDELVRFELEIGDSRSSGTNTNYWCFVKIQSGEVFTLVARRKSETSFICNDFTPTVPGTMAIGIVANEEAAFYEYGSTATFSARAKAPVPKSADYTFDMQSIVVNFDQNIQISECNAIFSAETERSLGLGFNCSAMGDRLYINLGNESEVTESLTILDTNSIRRAGSMEIEFSPNADPTVIPVSKGKVIPPSFTLTVPSAVCANEGSQPVVELIVSKLGNQRLKYKWTLPPMKEWRGKNQRQNMLMWQNLRAVEAELKSATGTADSIILSRKNLLPDIKYIINLSSTNFLNSRRDVSASLRIQKTERLSVTVKTFPSASVIIAEANIILCRNQKKNILRYKWMINDDVVSVDGKILTIPQRNPGDYNVSCLVFDHQTNKILGGGWTTTQIVKVPGRVFIFPTEAVFGIMDDIVLKAYIDETQFRWSCKTSQGEACIAAGPQGLSIDIIVNMTSSTIRIPGGTLPVGRYLWTLYGAEEATATVIISPRIPPLISIVPPSLRIDSTKTLSLNADVERLKEGCKIRWKTMRKKGYSYFSLEDVGLGDLIEIRVDDLIMQEREAQLVVPAPRGKWKGLIGNEMYLFRLETVCPDPTPDAHYDVTLLVNGPPSASGLTIVPETGEAITTKFGIHITQGSDSIQDYPLVHSLSCQDELGDEISLITTISTAFDVSLPPGKITVILKTCDVWKTCSKSRKLVTVQELHNISSQTVENLERDVRNLILSGDTIDGLGRAIVAFKTLSKKVDMNESLLKISSATVSAVKDRILDLSERLKSDPKAVKLSFEFLEQSVTSLKYFPQTEELVKHLTQFKYSITKFSQVKRSKREIHLDQGKAEINENLIKAIFELHSRNLENPHLKSIPKEVIADVRKYMLQLCSDEHRRPFLIDFPAIALRINKLSYKDLKKELPIADDKTAKLILTSNTIKPKSCLATVRYSKSISGKPENSERFNDIFEIRLIEQGKTENAPVIVTLPVANTTFDHKCLSWSDDWSETCTVISKSDGIIKCRCNKSAYVSACYQILEADKPTSANNIYNSVGLAKEGLLHSEEITTENKSESTLLNMTYRDKRDSKNELSDVIMNEGTVKAILDLHAKILERNDEKNNREEFLADVRKYMLEICAFVQDSMKLPFLVESTIVTLEIRKLIQNDWKKEVQVAGIRDTKLKFNFRSLPKKTCVAVAVYHKDFMENTTSFRISDIYEVRLITNGSFKNAFKDDIRSVALTIPVYNNISFDIVSCMIWKNTSGWQPLCTIKAKTNSTVTCGCKEPGIFTIFSANTTANSTTTLTAATPTIVSVPNDTVNLTTTTVSVPLSSTARSVNTSTVPIIPNSTSKNSPEESNRTVVTKTSQSLISTTPKTTTTTTKEGAILTSVIQNISNIRKNTSLPVSGTFKINGDYNEIVGKNATNFTESLKKQLAEQLNIQIKAIANVIVRRGSIIVTVLFIDTEETSAEDAIKELVMKLHDGTLRLTGQNATILNVPKQDLKVKIGPNVTRNTGRMRIITYSVVGGTCVAILLLALSATYFRRKSRRVPLGLPHLSIDDHPSYRQFHNEFSLDGSSASLARYRRDHPFETETIQ